MNELKKEFTNEINNLLSSYISESDLLTFVGKFEISNAAKNSSSELINNFYAQQLKIEYSFGKDRMQIDRTITFAQKTLSKEKYPELLKKLAQLCITHGKLNFAVEILKKILKQNLEDKEKAESYLLLSDVYSRRADWTNSVDALENANELFVKTQNKEGCSKCENMLGVIYGEKGSIVEAQNHFEKCLELINNEEEKEMMASVHSNLGIVMNIQGNYEKAIFYFEKALLYFEKVEDYRRIAELRQNIGMLYFNKNEFEAALQELDKSINIAVAKKLLPVLALSYSSKSNILLALGKYSAALAFADKALEISHLIDDKLTIADIYRTKSIIERNIKNYSSAENYLQSSLRLNANGGNQLNTAETKYELGELYGEMELSGDREKLLNESLRQYQDLNIMDRAKKIESLLSLPTA